MEIELTTTQKNILIEFQKLKDNLIARKLLPLDSSGEISSFLEAPPMNTSLNSGVVA